LEGLSAFTETTEEKKKKSPSPVFRTSALKPPGHVKMKPAMNLQVTSS
jgi:hypothetical protein